MTQRLVLRTDEKTVSASNGRSVLGSGTEPKIKYYLFARRAPAGGETFSPAQLAGIKTEVKQRLEAAWAWLQADADARLK